MTPLRSLATIAALGGVLLSGCTPAPDADGATITGPSLKKDRQATGSGGSKVKAKDLTLAKCKSDCTINTVTINVTYSTSDNTTGDGDAGDIDAVTLICYVGDDGIITDGSCTVSN